MSDSIKYFMWGYQPHFRISQKVRSESLFKYLDKDFEPEIFLVGILRNNRNDRYPACVEPEKDFWVHSTDFNKTLDDAKKIITKYPESKMFQSHPIAQQRQDEGLFKRAIGDAILQIINAHPNKLNQMQYFTSWPVNIDEYMVSLVLGLQKDIINRYPILAIDRIYIHECRSYQTPISLIDATVFEYFNNVASELLIPNPGEDLGYHDKTDDEILRAAGNHLTRSVGSKADIFNNQENEAFLLYDRLNRISSLKYEQKNWFWKDIISPKRSSERKRKNFFY